MSKRRKVISRIIIVVLFLISLYFVEAGFCGSSVVAEYNNGFGTLDMKKYDVQSVFTALTPMSEEGLNIYKMYYGMDYLFVIFFGLLQVVVTLDIYRFSDNMILKRLFVAVPIFRGVCDIVENTILLNTVNSFPSVNETAITVSSYFTQAKLISIRVWIGIVLLGLVWRLIRRIKRK